MTIPITLTDETRTKAELLAAIRKQTDAAGKDLPRSGAAALRDLAEAYAIVTTPALPTMLSDGF